MAMTKTEIQARYDAKNTVRFAMKLNTTTDAEIIAKLRSVPSIQGYIKQLIKADLAVKPTHDTITGRKYHIKPEYINLWGSDATDETVIDDIDVRLFAADWGKTKEEIIEQLIPID